MDQEMPTINPGKSPEAFPDAATCKVRRSRFGEFYDCLSVWAWRCRHALYVRKGYLCRHPRILEILARAHATQPEPPARLLKP